MKLKLKFINRASVMSFLFIILQQLIVAFSTISIVNLGRRVSLGSGYLLWLALFILSLIIVYIPTILTNYCLNAAKYETYNQLISSFGEQNYNSPDLNCSVKFKSQRQPYFTHEAWLIIQENYDFFADISSMGLSICLNVLVISFYLSRAFLASYAVAFPLTFICISLGKKTLRKRSEQAQSGRSAMMQTLDIGWDSILVGNRWNYEIWKKIFREKLLISSKLQRSATLMIDATSLAIMAVSSMPIVAALIYAFNQSGDPQNLSALVATLPRQIMTIQYLGQTINLLVQLSDKMHRTRQLAANLCFDKDSMIIDEYEGRISWGKIKIRKGDDALFPRALSDIDAFTNNYSSGRYTLSGENGSGKTTLMTRMKSILGDRAFLLPTHSKIIFENENKEFSTGEKLVSNLQEINLNLDKMGIGILLLDEWNANLDKNNIKMINEMIEGLQKQICIIEILHKN
ncbi:MAG: hypothetical protein LBU32_23645 [Clostridiales bacterium]|jgi:hypothetical protein|nr:hypothetical protein [Clostridiales bacterium]